MCVCEREREMEGGRKEGREKCVCVCFTLCVCQFSDMLLHTEPAGTDVYKFKNEMPLFMMKVN